MCCSGDGGLEQKLQCLENTPFYLYLEDADLRLVAGTFQKVAMAVGSILPSSPLYYVLKGTVEIRATDEKEGDPPITIRHTGAFFSAKAGQVRKKGGGRTSMTRKSTTDLTKDDASKKTVPIVSEAGHVLLVNEARMAKLIEQNPNIASVIDRMGSSNLEKALQAVPFISRAGLEPAQLGALAELGTYLSRGPGEDIFRQGEDASEPTSSFYICLHGAVDLWTSASAYRISGIARKSLIAETGDKVSAPPSLCMGDTPPTVASG